MVKSLCILGSTGSIGTQSLEVARELGIKISSLSANSNVRLLEEQVREFNPKYATVFDPNLYKTLKDNLKDTNTIVLSGMDGLCRSVCEPECDMVLNSLVGMIGLIPTITAIESKKDVALANKETLVVGGKIVKEKAKENGVKIIPIDSEHSAIFQCIQGCNDAHEIKKIILTASGGPFFGKSREELSNVTVDQALKHPNWSMGSKITIDSATMMNKGLEIIEACHLFDIPESKIDVLIHRESIVHSMVEYKDNAIIAQLGIPSMKIPIQYAFTYPERMCSSVGALDLAKISTLTFYEPDENNFGSMKLCRRAFKESGTMPAVLNGANEEAVNLFLAGKIKFLEIEQIVETAMNNISVCKEYKIDDIMEADAQARDFVHRIL